MTDLLLVNGTIHTLDPARPRARSIACADGKVESLDEAPAAKRVIDLKGMTVVPGFIDAHVHLLAYGRTKREVDLAGVTDFEMDSWAGLVAPVGTPPATIAVLNAELMHSEGMLD